MSEVEAQDFSEEPEFVEEAVVEGGDEAIEDGGEIGGMSVEEQARIAGWNPDHPAGKSAEEFLARNQEHLGLAKKENEKLYGEIGELKQSMNHMVKFLESREAKARQAGYDRAIREQEARMQQAVEDADTAAFHDAKSKAEQYMKAKEQDSVEPIVPEPKPAEVMQKMVNEHFSSSPPEMFDMAAKREVWIKELQAQGQQGKTLADAKKVADSAVIQMFNLKRSMPGLNEGGKGSGGAARKLADIPGAQQAYNTLKKKIPDLTVEEYLAEIQE